MSDSGNEFIGDDFNNRVRQLAADGRLIAANYDEFCAQACKRLEGMTPTSPTAGLVIAAFLSALRNAYIAGAYHVLHSMDELLCYSTIEDEDARLWSLLDDEMEGLIASRQAPPREKRS